MASKRRQRRKTCGDKQKWPTKDEAVVVAQRLRRSQPGHLLDAYRCPVCGQWHVGHRPKSVDRSIRDRRSNSQ